MKDSKNTTGTPYDDVFKTLVTDCPQLLVRLVNEIFERDYNADVEVKLYTNEIFVTSSDGAQEKKITDTHFEISGDIYHIECQSYSDGTILIRIMEYDMMIAMFHSKLENDVVEVPFPSSGIVYLRTNKNTPDFMTVKFKLPDGHVCEYKVQTLKATNYSSEEIFEKRLYFMIPFHIFSFEKELEECSTSVEKLASLQSHFANIRLRLEADCLAGLINEYDKHAVMQLSKKVIESIARKYKNVAERIGDTMGGTVLDYEVKDILMKGYNKAKKEDEIILEHNNSEYEKIIADKDSEINNLRKLLSEHGIDFSMLSKSDC